jgi:hypothetical protein
MSTLDEGSSVLLDRRRAVQLLALSPLAVPGLLSVPMAARAAEPRPVTPTVESIPLSGFSADGATTESPLTGNSAAMVTTSALETKPFQLAALTWGDSQHTAVTVRVRTRSVGRWSSWTTIPVDDHNPDPGSSEANNARGGTAPLIVPESDAIQVRVRPGDITPLPDDIRVDLVNPGESDADHALAAPAASEISTPRPSIFSRAYWGADESLREPGDPDYGKRVLGAFVHHTAGSNSYASWQVAGIIRSIYAYHVNGRGWRDIGYNFLIDRFGRIFEGRYGGVSRAVVGAHTGGYNADAFGAAAIGTYTSKTPESALLEAYEALFAWKFALHGVNPRGFATYPQQTLSPVAGHRDTTSTECPGGHLYARLTDIRDGTTHILDRTAIPSTLQLTGASSTTVGTQIWLAISWRTSSEGIDGIVNLQRKSGTSWTHIRQVTVRDGVAFTSITPGSTNTYRLRASRSTDPLNVRLGGSNNLQVTAVSTTTKLRLNGPSSASSGQPVGLTMTWNAGTRAVTGKVNLQRRTETGWTHIRQIEVINGSGSTTITPGASNIYRLRASGAASPSGVDVSHPVGTSNELRIVVSSG